MRLGKDALVFTQNDQTRSVGFLSQVIVPRLFSYFDYFSHSLMIMINQTMLKEIDAVEVLVPILSWDKASNQRIKNEFSAIEISHAKGRIIASTAENDINVEV